MLRDWRHANDTIIGVLQVQKDTMFIVLGMIVLVAAFNVVSSLIMLVKDKTRRYRRAAHDRRAAAARCMRIFLMCGAFVGVAGTLIGTVIGVVFCRNIVDDPAPRREHHRRPVFDASVFMLTALPNTIDWARCRPGCRAWPGAVAAGDAVSQAGARRAPIRWRRCGMSDPARAARRARGPTAARPASCRCCAAST